MQNMYTGGMSEMQSVMRTGAGIVERRPRTVLSGLNKALVNVTDSILTAYVHVNIYRQFRLQA